MQLFLDVLPRAPTGAEEILSRTTSIPRDTSTDSDLLKAIRSALRGTDAYSAAPISSTFFNERREPPGDDEICWDSETVAISSGGNVKKTWTFTDERQPVQYACFGIIEESWRMFLSAQSTPQAPPPLDPTDRPTFGAFARANMNQKIALDKKYYSTAIFVFLRSIGKVYLRNGIEYTFQLPFIIRKAWPMSPNGIMLQRVLEPYEIEEATLSGDEPLPTIFSFTNPFSEATPVGLAKGILGGFSTLPSLVDDQQNSPEPPDAIPHSEMIIFTSFRSPSGDFELAVTVDPGKRTLSVWRYVYIKPKDSHMAHQPTHTQLKPPASAPSLASLAKSAPSLSTTTTMASLMSAAGGATDSAAPQPSKPRRNSLTRNDLTSNLDNLVLGGSGIGIEGVPSMEYGRMTATHWMERLHTQEIAQNEAETWRDMTVALFDLRWDGTHLRCILGICSPASKKLYLYTVWPDNHRLRVKALTTREAISIASVRATRHDIRDLLLVNSDGKGLMLLTHGLGEIEILLRHSKQHELPPPLITSISLLTSFSVVQVTFSDNSRGTLMVDFLPQDVLTSQSLYMLSRFLTPSISFAIRCIFLEEWESHARSNKSEFPSFQRAIERVFCLTTFQPIDHAMDGGHYNPFLGLLGSKSHTALRHDKALKHLEVPHPRRHSLYSGENSSAPHAELGAAMFALHLLCEELRLQLDLWLTQIQQLAPLVCRMALPIRPEYVDYWKRKLPYIPCAWPAPHAVVDNYPDTRIPIWPPDFYVILQYKLRDHHENGGMSTLPNVSLDIHCNPNATRLPLWPDLVDHAFGATASWEYGRILPLRAFQALFPVYNILADSNIPSTTRRAELAVYTFFRLIPQGDFLNRIPFGLAAPIREAIKTTQHAPPDNWPHYIYTLIGRNDLAASKPDVIYREGYKSAKTFMDHPRPLETIGAHIRHARFSAQEVDNISGVELPDDDLMAVRFSLDRRLDEAARLLCSSGLANIRMMERHDLSELDQAKEYQNQLGRVAERTLGLSFGRGMLTFSTVTSVTREAYAVPKLEFTIRLQPQGITVPPDPGKISLESLQWGEFHNGVAAALRVASKTTGIESSWIAFNKPSAMTPQHAGFLYGLGLSGHLKEMMTWHTFGYLTMKHDLTSIGVLLGMAVAKVGTGDEHVTKLLAVHTPALLPNPNVDLNVSMMTQAAGLSGIGLLYLGTKNRRMAEVCLTQIRRNDLVQPSLSNEHREAYTYSAALAFGMIMVGKGSDVPADIRLVTRLTSLVHGSSLPSDDNQVTFDVNLTSPAATIALGLMYLRTERQDIADIISIPDTVLALNRVQPGFLLFRALSRALIMWNKIQPTMEWLSLQIPSEIKQGVEVARKQHKTADEALELAYFNIVTGACFAMALRFAGSANEAAYMVIIRQFDYFTRSTFGTSHSFDHRLRRSAIRDGLNLIGISLALIMVGTGELTCLRRLRQAYGYYQNALHGQPWKYGIHMANSMALGLLFLGGGRCVLGTSDAAIAAMVTAFFPRWHHASHDNKSFLQALRHLWVLAVEPRCLVARDVDTAEVVYLPLNLAMKDGPPLKLIAPTLFPNLDDIIFISHDTPRYWPFSVEVAQRVSPGLLRSQTIYIKRRSAYVSYNLDRKGSRCLLARTGSSAGDGAALDFPQVRDTNNPAAEDLADFLGAAPHDIYFLSFADHFCRQQGETPDEKLFRSFCLSLLFDCILHDKRTTMQAHLALFGARQMDPRDPSYHLRLHDLAFAAFFYGTIFPVLLAPRPMDGMPPHLRIRREPLIRDATVHAALYTIDHKLAIAKSQTPEVNTVISKYVSGELSLGRREHDEITHELAWFLVRHGIPSSSVLVALKRLAKDAYESCAGTEPPEGTDNLDSLTSGIKEVVHLAGNKMTSSMGAGWTVQGLNEVLAVWGKTTQ